MFKELAPVLRHRAVLMTITFAEDDQIRVNVVPKKLKDDENKALTTPLTITGTADELDAELGPILVDFVAAHLQLKNTLKQAKEEMDAAAKAAQAEARTKSKTPAPGKKDATTSTSTDAKPAQIAKTPAEPAPPPPPRTASLFDIPAPTPTPAAVAPAQPAAAPVNIEPVEDDEEGEILTEINDGEADDDEALDPAA